MAGKRNNKENKTWFRTDADPPEEDPEQITEDIDNDIADKLSLGSEQCLELARLRYSSIRTANFESRYGIRSRYHFRIPYANATSEIRSHLYRVFRRLSTAFKVSKVEKTIPNWS